MKIAYIALSAFALALLAVSGSQAKDESSTTAGVETSSAVQAAMTLGSPGEHHKALEPFVGKFTTISRFWMKPGEAPQESSGTVEHSWVLGGRFVKMECRGGMAGRPYEGLGYLGYDNIRGEYTSVWLDNFSTGIARSTGQFDATGKVLAKSGIASCPMTGEKDVHFRGEWKVIDNDNLSYVMYHTGSDGKEVIGMEISLRRVK